MKSQAAVAVKKSFKPLSDWICVKRTDKEYDGSIVIPDIAKQRSDTATVVSVGDGRIINGQLVPIGIDPGDEVLISRHGGIDFEVEGEKIVLLRVGDVYGKIVEEE